MRKTRLAELVESGSGAAKAIADLRKNPESFLATVQVGITVIGATAAAFGGASVAERLAPIIATVPFLAPFAEDVAVGIVVAAVSFLSLVLGELVPKSLALRAGESYALIVARPLLALAWAGRPAVSLLTGASNLVLRLFGDRTTFTESRLSREEIQQIVDEAALTGSVDPSAGEIASRALEFSGLDAYTVMVPRMEVATLPVDATVEQVAALARSARHGRVPVYEGNSDNYVGYANLRDLLAEAIVDPTVTLRAHLHPIVYVPEALPAPTLLRRLQAERAPLALVLDEQGTVVGLVTVEDLVEELVGEILSEHDKPDLLIVREADGTWLIAGNTPLHEVERALDVDLPDGDFSTLAGLCLHVAGSIPGAGWSGDAGGVRLEVVEATPRRVKRVRVVRKG